MPPHRDAGQAPQVRHDDHGDPFSTRLSIMDNITEKLAIFASRLTYEDLPATVVDQAKKCLLDFIGVAIRSSREDTSRKIFNFFKKLGGIEEASIIRYPHKTSCAFAALINGSMAHVLELDDGHIVGHVHPGVTSIPAALAVGEKIGASGKELITAMAAGYEAVIRIGDAVTPSAIYDRGIHAPGLMGAFGASVTVAKLFHLNDTGMTHAIGNCCLTPVAPFQTFTEGAMVKELYGGWPAFVGTLAACMAQEGFTGPLKLLEGNMGFCRTVADTYDLNKIIENLGNQWRMRETYFKKHASCSFSHTTMDAVLEIVASHRVFADDIQRVIVKTHRFASDLIEKTPRTVSAKKSSLPYCVALAIVKKRVFLDEFHLTTAEEEIILNLAQKVDVQLDPDMDRIHAADEGLRPAAVEIYLKNGPALNAQREVAKGWAENPFSDEELEQKFYQLVKDDLSEDRATEILQLVKHLDALDDISQVVEHLACLEA